MKSTSTKFQVFSIFFPNSRSFPGFPGPFQIPGHFQVEWPGILDALYIEPTHLNNKLYYMYVYNNDKLILLHLINGQIDMFGLNLYMNTCSPLSGSAST